MADFDDYKVDLNTPQPGGRQGESPRVAFTKYNDALDAIADEISAAGQIVSATAPQTPIPFLQWLDTAASPPLLKRRNAANDAWITIGPALQTFGSAASLNVPNGQTIFGTASGANMPEGVSAFGTAAGAAVSALLTKVGNLAGLAGLKQSQLNLGVIQSLAGEVFNTDNCTVTENANGTSMRFPSRIQLAYVYNDAALVANVAMGSGFISNFVSVNFPQVFASRPLCVPMASFVSLNDGRLAGSQRGWAHLSGPSTAGVSLGVCSTITGGAAFPGALAFGKW